MGYRKITVDGVEHEFVIGSTYVKVKGFQAKEREDVGHMVPWDPACGCCGEPMSASFPDEYPREKLVVTPADVEKFIRAETQNAARA